MTGAEIAIVAIAAAGAAVSYQSAKTQGKFRVAAAEREIIAAEEAAKRVEVEALQQEAVLRERATRMRSAQIAQAAALGFDPTLSRSFMALRRDTEKSFDRDIANAKLNALARVRQFELGADASRIAGVGAQAAAKSKGYASLLKGAGTIATTAHEGEWFD